MISGVMAASALFLAATPGHPAPDRAPVDHGLRLAKAYCSGCHAVDRHDPSPRRGAPAFRDLHNRYEVEDLQEALAEGISTGHPAMPEIKLWPDEVGDFIIYLKSLQTPPLQVEAGKRR